MSREPITFTLDEKVEFPGQPALTELTIRPFKGKDLLQTGLPFTIERNAKDGSVSEKVNLQACTLLIARMAAVPPSMIGELAAIDLITAIEALKVFFYWRTPETSSINIPQSESGAAA